MLVRIDLDEVLIHRIYQSKNEVDHHLEVVHPGGNGLDEGDPVDVTVGMIGDHNKWFIPEWLQHLGIHNCTLQAQLVEQIGAESYAGKVFRSVINLAGIFEPRQLHSPFYVLLSVLSTKDRMKPSYLVITDQAFFHAILSSVFQQKITATKTSAVLIYGNR